jgi:hypothetical protein
MRGEIDARQNRTTLRAALLAAVRISFDKQILRAI